MRKLFWVLPLLLIAGCSFTGQTDIAGDYLEDKPVLSNADVDGYARLHLSADGSFALSQKKSSAAKRGTWEVVRSGYAPNSGNAPERQATIEFRCSGTVTTAELRGNIIYFANPESAPFNVYKSVLFTKSSR